MELTVRLKLLGCALAIGALVSVHAAFAQTKSDETDAVIRAAQKSYRSGQLLDAKQKLDKASALIAAAAARKLQSFLPEPTSGWAAEPGDAEPSAGMTVSRNYAKGAQRITISISGDVRVIAEMAFMVLDAAQAKEAGARMVKVNGSSGVVTSDGQIQVLVANRFLVIAEGDAAEDAKKDFLEKIDAKGLSKL